MAVAPSLASAIETSERHANREAAVGGRLEIGRHSRAPSTRGYFIGPRSHGPRTRPAVPAGDVHLFAASQGLASWFHKCDRIGRAGNLNLRTQQRALFAQTVG